MKRVGLVIALVATVVLVGTFVTPASAFFFGGGFGKACGVGYAYCAPVYCAPVYCAPVCYPPYCGPVPCKPWKKAKKAKVKAK
jgi:hypothetical protein